MKEKEIELDGKKIKVVTKIPREYIEDNNTKNCLDDTIDLNEIIEEVNRDE